jgi:hypothetical protein
MKKTKIKSFMQRVRKLVRQMGRVLELLILVYVLLWGAMYAYAQSKCISYHFETTEVNFMFKPYCVGLYHGDELVIPLTVLEQIEKTHIMGSGSGL